MDEFDFFPVSDAIDSQILMHRDAHFGSSFPVMLDYYATDGKGIDPDFSYERILFLSHLEEQLGHDLSETLLSPTDQLRVSEAKEAYQRLRDLYETENAPQTSCLLADLILSEEEIPEEEIQAIVALKEKMVLPLIDLLHSDKFFDPLFPGYGFAPELAAICLGKIGSVKAIAPLFESLGREGFSLEESVLEALRRIGTPAKEFLLKQLSNRPLTYDNEKAAQALSYFGDDPKVAEVAFNFLSQLEAKSLPGLAPYLIFCCEGLKDAGLRMHFETLAKDPNFASKDLRSEMELIAKSWVS